VSQDVQKSVLFLVHRSEPEQAAAIPTKGFNDIQAFEFFDDTPRGHVQAALANLVFKQAVSQQSQHVDE
jgi:hypothetical protein